MASTAAKITFISYDDAYSPPKTVEMTRKLVESDNVLFLLGSLGTLTNTAIWRYTNENKVQERLARIEASVATLC